MEAANWPASLARAPRGINARLCPFKLEESKVSLNESAGLAGASGFGKNNQNSIARRPLAWRMLRERPSERTPLLDEWPPSPPQPTQRALARKARALGTAAGRRNPSIAADAHLL